MGVTRNIRDRLIAIQKTITVNGTTCKAAPSMPYSNQDFELPLFVNIPGRRTTTRTATQMLEDARTWTMRCYIKKAILGLPTETEDFDLDLIDAVDDVFVGLRRLDLNGVPLDNVDNVRYDGDNGIVIQRMPSGNDDRSAYRAIDFLLTVISSRQANCI